MPVAPQEGASKAALCPSDAGLGGGVVYSAEKERALPLPPALLSRWGDAESASCHVTHRHMSETQSPVHAPVRSQGPAPCTPAPLSPSDPGPQKNKNYQASVLPTATQPAMDPTCVLGCGGDTD